VPPRALATRVLDAAVRAKCSTAPQTAPTPTAANGKRAAEGQWACSASKVGCSARTSVRLWVVSLVAWTRWSGTKTSSTAIVRLPVARRPVGNQSSIVVASSLGTRNMWPSPPAPAGALKNSHSVKSEPLQNPQLPVRR